MGCLPLHRDHACPHNPSFSDRFQALTQVREHAIALLLPTDIPHGMGRLDSQPLTRIRWPGPLPVEDLVSVRVQECSKAVIATNCRLI